MGLQDSLVGLFFETSSLMSRMVDPVIVISAPTTVLLLLLQVYATEECQISLSRVGSLLLRLTAYQAGQGSAGDWLRRDSVVVVVAVVVVASTTYIGGLKG